MPAGRPTKYRKRYCKEIVEFFNREPYTEVEVVTTDKKSGRKYINEELRPAILPTMERFSFNIGVDTDTLVEWTKVHPEFSAAVTRAKHLQKDILIANGLAGLYNSGFAVFVSKNLTDLRDKKEMDLTHHMPEPLLGGTTPLPDEDEEESEAEQ